ncbi:MAG TPA: hypothetical protein VFD36_13830 [Kofleriaceae bacterium]|nr:hypothetical protein [Kofleriaceae bacterium]
MDEGLIGPGFYPQPNEWTCGPFALKHALLALGRMVDVNQISTTARTHWWSGTNEIQLARAARAFECDLVLERRGDAEQARKILVKYLREQTPVLLCVDEWSHWITVVRAEDRRFVVINSMDDPLLSVCTWPQLRNRWRYHDTDYVKDNPPILYDLMAVSPRFRTTVKADFSVDRVKFLRRHQELLLTRVVYWHGDISRDEVGRVLRDMRFVSETYGLVIPASMSRRALADLAILVSVWACAQRGVDGMFGAPGADPRPEPKSTRRKNGRK